MGEQARRRDEIRRTFESARAIKAHYMAKITQLEQKSGALIPKDDVKVAAFNCARSARDALLGIPGRIATLVPGRSMQEVRALLRQEIDRVLEVIDAQR